VSSVRLPGMRFVSRLLPPLFALVALLVLAPAAMAADGVGVYGRTDDKVVTFFAFGLIAFFAILVTVLSLIQIRLENRKERRTKDLERLGSR
jgi:putative copper export protein